jgi:hypothetical protein
MASDYHTITNTMPLNPMPISYARSASQTRRDLYRRGPFRSPAHFDECSRIRGALAAWTSDLSGWSRLPAQQQVAVVCRGRLESLR